MLGWGMRIHTLLLAAPLAALAACVQSETPQARASAASTASSPEIRTVMYKLTGLT